MKAVLGLDTSNYVTSMALVSLTEQVVLNARLPLSIAHGTRGLQQSEAVFQHIKQLPQLFYKHPESLREVEVVAVCASAAPRPVENSYMPVFAVGEGQGRTSAQLLDVPFFVTTHQEGHLYAAMLGSALSMNRPFLALHLSGGTTELLCVDAGKLSLLGGTLDLHAGQLVDRIGVALGLAFPAGSALEELALSGRSQGGLSVSVRGMSCHLSGAEAQALRWIAQDSLRAQDIAREVYDFLARSIVRILQEAARRTGEHNVLLMGGVASSGLLRTLLQQRLEKRRSPLKLHFAQPALSGDNAVGVAMVGRDKFLQRMK